MNGFLHLDEDSKAHATDLRVEAIDSIVDLKEHGTVIFTRDGRSYQTEERTEHLKMRIERLR